MINRLRTASLILTALMAAFATTAPARPTHSAPLHTAVAKPPAQARPALWKVSDADTTIWLFGTIHALPKGVNWLNGPVAKALDGSQVLVTEIPDTPPEVLQGVILKTALLPKGKSLHAMLSARDAALLDKTLKSYGLPPAAFDQYEPWFVSVTLATLPLAKSGYSPEDGVEAQLAAKAKADGRQRQGLETAEYQLGLFDSLPVKLQIHYLHEVLTSLPSLPAELRRLLTYWSAGDPVKLAQLINADEDDPQMAKTLIYDRNHAWANWIANRLNQPGTVFIAVGAGHLAGPRSVQDQLGRLGLRVTRVQ